MPPKKTPDEALAEVMQKLKERQEADHKRLLEETDEKNNNGGDSSDDGTSDEEYEQALKHLGDGSVDPKNKELHAKNNNNNDDDDEDSPYLIGKEGTKIKRPLGTKREVRELAEYSRTEADLSFAENLAPDPVDGLRPITWTQLKKFIGYERVAKGFKLTGVICTRDQANWDKIKHIEVRDEDGIEKALFFYDSDARTFQWENVNVGNRLTMKEPRFHRFMDGSEGVRVESCDSILSVVQQKFSDEDRLNFGRRHKQNGNLKYEQRRYDDAIDEYDHAIRHLSGTFHEAPSNEATAKELAQSCFLNIAACFVAEGKFTQVEAPCRKALTFNANKILNSKAYYRIGQAEEALGNNCNARVALERANELFPGDPKIVELLNKVRGTARELSSAQKQLYSQKEEKLVSLSSLSTTAKKNGNPPSSSVVSPTPPPTTPAHTAAAAASTTTTKRTSTNSRRNATPLQTPQTTSPIQQPTHQSNSSFGSNASIQKFAGQNSHGTPIPRVSEINYKFGFATSVLDALSQARIEMENVDNFRDLGNLKIFRQQVIKNLSGQNSPILGAQEGGERSSSTHSTSSRSSNSSPARGATRTITSTVRKHLLYRSATLVGLTPNDMNLLKNRLRIKTVIDLRNNDEITKRIIERKEFVETENKKRARVKLDMKKAEISARRRLTQQEKLEKVKRDKYGVGNDDDNDNNNDGMRNRNNNRGDNNNLKRTMKDAKPNFSIDPDVMDRDSADDEEELQSINEYMDGLERDPELKKLQFVDTEAHFRPVIVKCTPGRVPTYTSRDYEEFAEKNAALAKQAGVTRQEWIRQHPVTFHIDFSSRTIFALASWWVWVVVMILALCLQINLATNVVVRMTAARIGAVAYYRALLVHQKEEIREIFNILADMSNFPVLICCQLGKDRTGVVIALILLALGVPKEDIIKDYTRTKSTKTTDAWVEKVGLTAEEWKVAKAETIQGLIELIEDEGGIESYLKGIDINEETLENVRSNLTNY